MTQHKTLGAYILIGLGACLWGTLGPLAKDLFAMGLSPITIVFWRLFIAMLVIGTGLALYNARLLVISRHSILYFVLFGLISQGIYNMLYFTAIDLTNVSTAVTLLYTAPAFVTVLARFIFREPLTTLKILGVIVSLTGCVLVVGGLEGKMTFTVAGVTAGLGAGLTYALYTLFSKGAVSEYNSWTVVFYSLAFGALFILPFADPGEVFTYGTAPGLWFRLAGVALVGTVGACGLYIMGLSKGAESSRASIVATLELVVAVLLGCLVSGETLTGTRWLGTALVCISIFLVYIRKGSPENKQDNTAREPSAGKYLTNKKAADA